VAVNLGSPYYGSWRALTIGSRLGLKRKYGDELFQLFHCESDMEYTMIDATIVRAQACAAGLRKNTPQNITSKSKKKELGNKLNSL
jgi:hypothetical protein